jgi:F-type H+-transporting ATPase subunit epsilon
MLSIKLKIATPERVVYENDGVVQATIPTMDGEITVLPHHIPLISVLKSGELRIKDTANQELVIAIAGGFLEVHGNNEIVILADNAERAEEIDINRALAAQERAQKEMASNKSTRDIDFARLQVVIDREMNRIRVGKKYQKFPPSEYKKLPNEDLSSRSKE